MNSVMGCLADCAEMLPEDSYYSEYCGGRIRGRGEEPSDDTVGRDQLSRDDASDDIWSDEVAVPTGQRVRSGSEPGQRTGECEVITRPRSTNQYQAVRLPPRLPPAGLPAAAERAAKAQERAARAFALAEEAARAAKAAEETADRAVKAAETAAASKLAGRPRSLEYSGAGLARSPADRHSVNCYRDVSHSRRGGDGGSFVLRKGEPLPSSTTVVSTQFIAPRTTVLSPLPSEREIDGTKQYIHKDEIKEKQKQEGRRDGPGIGRMDSAAESDSGHAMVDGASGSPRKIGPRMSTASTAKPTASPARVRDVSRHKDRGRQQGRVTVTVGAARTVGRPRRRSRTPSVELSEVSDSDLSGLMVETVATTPNYPKAPVESDSAVTRVPAPGRRGWEVESTNGSDEAGRRRASSTEKDEGSASEGANAYSGVGNLKANSEVAWHGHMHDRAAIMGVQWRQLVEPKMELDSKLSSLSTDSSVTESHMDPDSLTRRSPPGATASDSRSNRIWAQSPEERNKTQSRARSATRCRHVTTHLRNIELSQDGTILTVRPGGGKSQFEFTLADLLEVKENTSEETVTLVGKDIEISIVFEGQAVALQQFSATLVPALLRQGVIRDCDRDVHDVEGGSRRGHPKSTVREDEARKLVLEEGSSSDSDDEDLPISHPERLTPSSSVTAVSNHTTRTRASTGTKSMWIMDSDKPAGTSVVGWDTLIASPVVSISSTSSSVWDRGGPAGKSSSRHVPVTEEWELGEPSDRFESLRELPPSRSPRSLLSSAQCQAEREERRARRRQQKGKRPDSASVEHLSFDAKVAPVAQTSTPPPPPEENEEEGVKSNGGSTRPGEATLSEAGKLLRDARRARKHARARLQVEGVSSRLSTSGGSNHLPGEDAVEGILEDDQVEAKVPNDREQSMSNAGHRVVPVVGSEKLCCGEQEKHWMESPESPPSSG